MKSDIIVSGISCISASGEGLDLLKDAGKIIDPVVFGDCLSCIDSGRYEMHRIQKIVLISVIKALESAKIDIKNNTKKIAFLFANTYGVEDFKSGFYKMYRQSPPDLTSPSLFPYTTANSLAANVAIFLGLDGINITFASGTISSSEAIIAGCDILNSEKADVVIVCGENFFCEDFSYEQTGFLSECCASLVLEKKDISCNKNDAIYGIIKNLRHGFEVNNNRDINEFNKINLSFKNSKISISLDGILGNTSSASGCLGVILSCMLLKGINVLGINAQNMAGGDEILFFNIDSYGGLVELLIAGVY